MNDLLNALKGMEGEIEVQMRLELQEALRHFIKYLSMTNITKDKRFDYEARQIKESIIQLYEKQFSEN